MLDDESKDLSKYDERLQEIIACKYINKREDIEKLSCSKSHNALQHCFAH